MANRIPLVIGSTGEPRQLPAGDTLVDAGGTEIHTLNLIAGTSGGLIQILPNWISGQGGWIDMPTAQASGIGSGGVGQNAWVGYAASAGQWFNGTNKSATGDICYRNSTGHKIHIGIDIASAGNASPIMTFDVNSVGIGVISPAAFLHVLGTSSQLRLGYSATVYLNIEVTSAGAVNFTMGGLAPTLNFTVKSIFTERIRFKGYTVATLPAGPVAGDSAFVTDALAPAFAAIVVGGGAINVRVMYNGANWICN